MITKIQHISTSKILATKINYNENKVSQKLGTLIVDNTFSDKKEERLAAFNDVIDSNKNVKSNLAFEVCFSFPRGENVEDEKFKEVLSDYIKNMGYENAPSVCYRHDDKLHQHYHVIISHIDWEGKKLPQYNMFVKSLKLSRELEIKHGLKITEYKKSIKNESLNAIDARKFYFSNAIVKGLKAYSTKNYLERNMTSDQKKLFIDYYKKNNQLTNQEVSILLGEKAGVIKDYLFQMGMFNISLKNELYKAVENVLKNSENKTEFLNNLEKENIYVRMLYNNERKPYFIYGIKDMSFYVKDNDLAKKFAFNNLFEMKNDEAISNNELKTFDIKEQKNYIKTISKRVLNESRSLKEFSEKLNEKGIALITYENISGIYGVSFKSTNIANPELIKGSEVGLSWQEVDAQIRFNDQAAIKEIIIGETPMKEIETNNNYIPYIPTNTTPNRGEEPDDVLKKKKKKKKGNERGREM